MNPVRPHRLWRFLSPAAFAYALVLLPLPWIQVRCCQEFSDGSWRETAVPTSQTGLETMTGAHHGKVFYSLDLRRFPPWRKTCGERLSLKAPPRPAPLVTAYTAALCLGLLGGLFLRRPAARLAGVGTCALAAFALLALQTIRGFPAAELVADHNRRALRVWREEFQRSPSDLESQRRTFVSAATSQDNGQGPVWPCLVVLRYTPWFYLSLVLPLAAYATVLLEWLTRREPPVVRGQLLDAWGPAAPDALLRPTGPP